MMELGMKKMLETRNATNAIPRYPDDHVRQDEHAALGVPDSSEREP